MTFSEVAQLVISGLAIDGDSSVEIPESAPYFSTGFGLRLAIILRAFTVDTYCLFSPLSPIEIAEGDLELDLADPAKSSLSFHDVQRVWVEGNELVQIRGVFQLLTYHRPDAPTGTPGQWAQSSDSRIIFDLAADSDLQGHVSGFYRHPAITSDANQIALSDETVLLFDRYAQTFFRRDAAGDEVGLARLRMMDRQAYDGVMSLKGAQMRRHYRGTL